LFPNFFNFRAIDLVMGCSFIW